MATTRASKAEAVKKASGTKKASATAVPAKKAAAAKPVPAAKRAAPAKKAPLAKQASPAKAPARKPVSAKAAPAKKAPAAHKAAATSKADGAAVASKTPIPKKAAATKKAAPVNKTAVKMPSSFDKSFLDAQRSSLIEERNNLLGQAQRLETEAAELMEDLDPGDVQFDDESGEGDSLVVERERDLALSAQARQTIADIDAALERIADGSYGHSVVSGRPIPKERLKAIPWATELVEEKVGGLGRR